MAARTYRYVILRYIPDLMRMEPRNVGVIVQSDEGIVHQIHGRFVPESLSDRGEARASFRAWREWFDHELHARIAHALVPKRTSEAYLSYLASRCTGNYQLTEPLRVQAEVDLNGAAGFLCSRLVLTPGGSPSRPRTPRSSVSAKSSTSWTWSAGTERSCSTTSTWMWAARACRHSTRTGTGGPSLSTRSRSSHRPSTSSSSWRHSAGRPRPSTAAQTLSSWP